MELRKIAVGLIALIIVVALILFLLPEGNDYYLIDQDGENVFHIGDTIYGQLNEPAAVFISIDGSEGIVPEYNTETQFILPENLLPGRHTLIVQIEDAAFQQDIIIQDNFHIYAAEIEEIIHVDSIEELTIGVSGYEMQNVEEGQLHWVTADVTVKDTTGTIIDHLSSSAESVGGQKYATEMIVPIDTNGLPLGEYTIEVMVTDQVTQESLTKEVSFIVI